MKGSLLLSVIIPNHNGADTLAACLSAACAQESGNQFEIIVVDDCSDDGSEEIIKRHAVELVSLKEHAGASMARNAGAARARGKALFFIDADCVMPPGTLIKVEEAFNEFGESVVGGTYTPLPHDKGFFSTFQSIYINYSETKHPEPDYVATHAMLISKEAFDRSGGFQVESEFMPILEDVEFSHRLRDSGMRLIMRPEIQVQHIFNFTLWRSLRNAYRKSRYWVRYSRLRGDLGADSGTASIGLKVMAGGIISSLLMLIIGIAAGSTAFIALSAGPAIVGILNNSALLAQFFRNGGFTFGLMATAYYALLYPIPAVLGGIVGLTVGLTGRR